MTTHDASLKVLILVNLQYIKFLELVFDKRLWKNGKMSPFKISKHYVDSKTDINPKLLFSPTMPWLPTINSLFSCTPHLHADYICNILKLFHGKLDNIFDAGSCVGGNTIAFAQYFDVISILFDWYAYNALKHNVLICGVLDKVQTYLGDIFDYRILDCKILFIDPPWGGMDGHNLVFYNTSSTILLCIQKLIDNNPQGYLTIVIKHPTDYEFNILMYKNKIIVPINTHRKTVYNYTIHSIHDLSKVNIPKKLFKPFPYRMFTHLYSN